MAAPYILLFSLVERRLVIIPGGLSPWRMPNKRACDGHVWGRTRQKNLDFFILFLTVCLCGLSVLKIYYEDHKSITINYVADISTLHLLAN